jgi:hypothetical protein
MILIVLSTLRVLFDHFPDKSQNTKKMMLAIKTNRVFVCLSEICKALRMPIDRFFATQFGHELVMDVNLCYVAH